MNWLFNDGGRTYSGLRPHHTYKGKPPGDCVARSIAIACDYDYRKVCKMLFALVKEIDRRNRLRDPGCFTLWQRCRYGVQSGLPQFIYEPLLRDLGFVRLDRKAYGVKRVSCLARTRPRAPTARLGLPWLAPEPETELVFPGRYIASVHQHLTCVIDGDCHDVHDATSNRVYKLFVRRNPATPELRDFFE